MKNVNKTKKGFFSKLHALLIDALNGQDTSFFLTLGKQYQLIPRDANFLWIIKPYTNFQQTS